MALNFKVADNEKFNSLWSLVNTNYTEENEWAIDYSILEIHDENFLAKNHETGEYSLIPYSVDENNVYSLGEVRVSYSIYLTNEGENDILNTIKEKNNNTFDGVVENFEKIVELGNKIEEANATISTLTTERDESIQNYEAIKEELEALKAEKEGLEQYKLNKENEEKNAIVAKYSAKLSEEVLAPYKDNLSTYSIIDLKKDLAYELVNSDNSLFAKQEETYIPKDETVISGIDEILNKYNK